MKCPNEDYHDTLEVIANDFNVEVDHGVEVEEPEPCPRDESISCGCCSECRGICQDSA